MCKFGKVLLGVSLVLNVALLALNMVDIEIIEIPCDVDTTDKPSED